MHTGRYNKYTIRYTDRYNWYTVGYDRDTYM